MYVYLGGSGARLMSRHKTFSPLCLDVISTHRHSNVKPRQTVAAALAAAAAAAALAAANGALT